jgi:hypothetical protein
MQPMPSKKGINNGPQILSNEGSGLTTPTDFAANFHELGIQSLSSPGSSEGNEHDSALPNIAASNSIRCSIWRKK